MKYKRNKCIICQELSQNLRAPMKLYVFLHAGAFLQVDGAKVLLYSSRDSCHPGPAVHLVSKKLYSVSPQPS